jgi:hypothetical protein
MLEEPDNKKPFGFLPKGFFLLNISIIGAKIILPFCLDCI